MALKAGVLCFYNDTKDPVESWSVGYVTDIGKGITVKNKEDGQLHGNLSEANVVVARDDLLDEDVNDLLLLTVLHDATLLRCLKLRYFKDVVYTNIGAIVVALNPFNFKIPHYMDTQMPSYLAEGHTIKKNLPHSWGVAHNTYWEMIDHAQNQCILVSGESGAGKTEAAKIVMKYLGAVSSLQGSDDQKKAAQNVGVKITQASPILEAFGNAKTVRNDNSSRFGKFSKVKFDSDGFLVGNFVIKYLLEKSRIISANPNERVYHAFYLVAQGKDAAQYRLRDPKEYKPLKSGGCIQIDKVDDGEDYALCLEAMKVVGIDDAEQKAIWRVVAGFLAFQNVEFEASGTDASSIVASTMPELEQAVDAFQVELEEMKKELLTTTRSLKGEVITTKLKKAQAYDGRDAVTKVTYDSIFGWLVDRINSTTDKDVPGNWIGLLDIFGFEDFEYNSFEQVCINLANETLQNHYNTYIFDRDMKECAAEGVDVSKVECPDNTPCLNMITGKLGVFALLDEECSLGEGTDAAFLSKLEASQGSNPFFAKKRMSKTSFIIRHYASDVTYEVEGFRDKNMDPLKDAMKLVMRASRCPFVKDLLPEPAGSGGKKVTVCAFFKQQLQDLLSLINSTNPHWIRCIKPHPLKKPRTFHGVSVMNQLSSSGVLGTVKIRKAGYPVRVPFDAFTKRYKVLAPGICADFKIGSAEILAECGYGKDLAQIGATKVFMKSDLFQELEVKREEALSKYSYRLQAVGRGWAGRFKVFMLYVKKNVERLRKEKAEKEAREREERERREREEAEKRQRERHAREQEERRRREEEERNRNLFHNSAVAIQRHIRGVLARAKTSRLLVELYRARYEAQVERRIEAERKKAEALDAERLAVEQAYMRDLQTLRKKKMDELKERERRERREKLATATRERLEARKSHDANDGKAQQRLMRSVAKEAQEEVREREREEEAARRAQVKQETEASRAKHTEWEKQRRRREKFFAARAAATDKRMEQLSELYAYKRTVELQQDDPESTVPHVKPLGPAQSAALAQAAEYFASPGHNPTKHTLARPALGSPEILEAVGQELSRVWRAKPGDVLDELLGNLVMPPGNDMPTCHLVLLQCVCEKLQEAYPRVDKSPLALLLMKLFTQEPADIDRMLTWKDAPTPYSPPSEWAAYAERVDGKRNTNVHAEVHTCLMEAYAAVQEGKKYEAGAVLARWCKTIGLLLALSEPLPAGVFNLPLHHSSAQQAWAIVEQHRQLRAGQLLANVSPLTSSGSAHAMRGAVQSHPPQSSYHLVLRGVQEGVNTGAVSQYPSEDEILLPPLTLFEVVKSLQTPHGTEVHAQCVSFLGTDIPDLLEFRKMCVADLAVAEQRLVRIKDVLNVHRELKKLPSKAAQRFTPPTGGMTAEERKRQFERSKQLWQDRENWMATREEVLSREWSIQEERERNALLKQHLSVSRGYTCPPSSNNLGPPSASACYGASPSTLSKKQRDLERDFQWRVEKELMFDPHKFT